MYVNQSCHHFTLAVSGSELAGYMSRLLIEAYDPLFTDISLEESSLNKEKAYKLLEEINSTLMSISKSVLNMKDSEKEKILNPRSSVYITISTQAKEASEKYVKLVDDYFKNGKRL